MSRVATPVGERFEAKYIPEPNSGCWLWTGKCSHNGYGQLNMPHGSDGKQQTVSAHRVAYEFVHGPIPVGLWVLHKCDVRSCVNPDHLFLGSRLDNMADMSAKGRSARGENSGMAKLTDADVRAIRGDDRQDREIAEDYGVTPRTVERVKSRERWNHIK